MFKRIYLRIAATLMFGTFGLLVLLGSFVYLELRRELQSEGQTALRAEVGEVQQVVTTDMLSQTRVQHMDFSDEKGQHIAFVVMDQGVPKLESSSQPLPSAVLLHYAVPNAFIILTYRGEPYRIYAEPWNDQGHQLTVYVYRLISQDQEMLERVSHLVLLVGGAGAVLAVALNLWMAQKALLPARQAWLAHQKMMIELSHELKTPLATIRAIVSTRVADERIRTDLSREIEQASEMVSDILYLSKLRTLPETALEPVAVSDITEEVVTRFVDPLGRRAIVLEGTAEPGLFVQTRSEHWARLVSTLLKNVVDHARTESRASWSLRSKEESVVLMVTNEPESDADRRGGADKGFGIAIAHGLADQMNGQLLFQEIDGDYTVILTVPRLRM